MIPSTFLGLALFAASLGPGYVFLRHSGRRRPQREGSQLEQAVEMVTFGALFSLIAATLVLGGASLFDIVDEDRLIDEHLGYAVRKPLVLVGALTALLLAYAIAWVASCIFNRGRSPAIVPGATAWMDALRLDRPDTARSTFVHVELRDGRQINGEVATFTNEFVDNRELTLWSPAVQREKGGPFEKVDARFLILRESDIVWIDGRYLKDLDADERQALIDSGGRHPDAPEDPPAPRRARLRRP